MDRSNRGGPSILQTVGNDPRSQRWSHQFDGQSLIVQTAGIRKIGQDHYHMSLILFLHTCVFIFWYAHTYIHPSMHPCMHPSIHPCIHACTYIFKYLYMCVKGFFGETGFRHMNISISIHIYIYMCIYIYLNKINLYIYIYINMCIYICCNP